MPDQASLTHAARVLALVAPDRRADAALRLYFEHHRLLDPRVQRAASRAVFAYFRWLAWLDPKLAPPRRLEHALAWHERFKADEKSVKPEALAARAVPPWLKTEMDEIPAAWLRQLQREPALWIRAKLGREAEVLSALGHCAPAVPSALRLPPSAIRYAGAADLHRTPAFHAGAFEIQDLASQLVGHACAPQPGETWWDACAGEGGKTLHLADLMQNQGLIWATDRSARRLEILRRRAARAGVFNYRAALWDGGPRPPVKTKFDGILVDAPCSGVGTWQRNPHARWTATPDDVRELAAVQRALLDHAASALKPGGRLVYSVCTLTRRETAAVADAFAAAHPELEPHPLGLAPLPIPGAEPAAPASRLLLWPHELNANGMFLAAWRRKP